jgi:hypothetical protein
MENLKLSVFFNTDRVYLMVCEPTDSGLNLVYVNSTDHPIDLENIDSGVSAIGKKELLALLNTITLDIKKISVTLSADSVLVSHLPGKKNITKDEIKQLIALEIRQAYPMFSFEDFTSSVVPTEADSKGKSLLIAIIIQKQLMKNCQELLQSLNAPIEKFEISQINAHQAFIYNYPEYMGLNIAFLGVQNQFVDISVANGNSLYHYNLVSLPNKESFGDICAKEVSKLIGNQAPSIDLAVFFGSGLTKQMLDNAKISLKNIVMEVDRLNAFRMVKATINDRQRAYCSRTSHIFPPSIGAFISYVENKINLY